MAKQSSENLKKWLDKLQQESWQLELILSGFAIFLILGLKEPLDQLVRWGLTLGLSSTNFDLIFIQIAGLRGAWFTLLFNLIVHLILRGVWISTIGLRYVSDDIDFEQLRLAPKFHNFLTKRIKSFDRYIEQLEKLCSVIFAFSFLIVFIILSISLYYLAVRLIEIFILDWASNNLGYAGELIHTGTNFIFTTAGLIYLVDFLSLGRLKRIKWLAPIYFPFYRLIGWLTLANLYRPIYYNLADNKFGRRVSLLIFPYLILGLFLSSVHFQVGKYLPKYETSKYHFVDQHYDDQAVYDGELGSKRILPPSISSKYVENGFLEIFLPYTGALDNPSIEEVCPDIIPAKDDKVIFRGAVRFDFSAPKPYNLDSIIQCFQAIHRLGIDGIPIEDPDFMIYDHPTREVTGFLVTVDVDTFQRGKHVLSIEKYGISLNGNQTNIKRQWQEPINIPFWKVDRKEK